MCTFVVMYTFNARRKSCMCYIMKIFVLLNDRKISVLFFVPMELFILGMYAVMIFYIKKLFSVIIFISICISYGDIETSLLLAILFTNTLITN